MACLSPFSIILCLLFVLVEVEGFVYVKTKSKNATADFNSAESKISAGRTYRIRNKKSNLYMSEVSFTSNRGVSIEQFPLATDKNRASQVWHVFPIENDRYLIANRRTGLVLCNGEKNAQGVALTNQCKLQEILGATQTWLLKVDSITDGFSYYTIENERSGLYLVIGSFSETPGAAVHDFPLQDGGNRAPQKWSFEVEEEFPTVLEATKDLNRTVGDIGDIQRITMWQQPRPSMTDEVLVGQVAIPFPLVNDGQLCPDRQSRHSPYYILRRYGYWQTVHYHEHSGATLVTLNVSVRFGLITNNAAEVEGATGLLVGADDSIGARFKPSLIRSSLGSGLRVIVGGGQTVAGARTTQFEQKYVTLNRLIDVLWYRQDHFVLERMNGDVVLQWITRDSNTFVNDGFRGRQMVFSDQ